MASNISGLLWWLSGKEPTCQDMQEMWVQSLGWEDPLEKEMATHSSFLAWEISWLEAGYSPWGCQRVRHDLAAKQQQII